MKDRVDDASQQGRPPAAKIKGDLGVDGAGRRLKEAEERSDRNQRRRRTPKAPKQSFPATAGHLCATGRPAKSSFVRAVSNAPFSTAK
jgi:hypothetical protein